MNKEKEILKKKIIDFENGVKDWCIVENKSNIHPQMVEKAFNKIKNMKNQYRNMTDLETEKNESRKIFIV